MSTHHEKGEFDHLKEELRRLKRTGAPWYFESELHRRLHGMHTRRFRLAAFPLNKAYVITFVALASLAAAGYMMMVHAGLFAPRPGAEAGNVAAAPPDTLFQSSPRTPPARSTAPPRQTAAEATTPVPLQSRTGKAAADSPTDAIPVARDSAVQSEPLPGAQDMNERDSLQGAALARPKPSTTDSAKSAKAAIKGSTPARPDSVRGRGDTTKPAQQGVPGK